MAISWLTVLTNVPWAEVIRSAPKVAEGAKKLWSTVSGKPPSPQVSSAAQAHLSPEAQAIAKLQAQMNDLHGQMLASSELIKALAEQNAELIKRVELNRVRVLWLAAAAAALGIVAVSALIVTLVR